MIERSLVLVKPDGVQRALIGTIISRFEASGLKIIGMKMVSVDKNLAEKHYPEDLIPNLGEKTKKSYEKHGIEFNQTIEERGEIVRNALLKFISEGPVVAMVLEGVDAVMNVRRLVGDTGPSDALPGTIRGDLAHVSIAHANLSEDVIRNLIHASGDREEAKKEIKLWFSEEEMYDYKNVHDEFIK